MFKLIKIVLPITLFIVFGFTYIGFKSLNKTVSHSKHNEYITISKGTSTQEIVQILSSAGILKEKWSFLIYVKIKGLSPKFKAGDYRFPTPISPIEVANKLVEGQQKSIRLTIIEGWTRWDIANALVKIPEFNNKTPQEILTLMNNTSKVRQIDPKANNLEGFLYPDTYYFPINTTIDAVIDTLVNKSISIWSPEFISQTQTLKKTPREILTVASMIETEAKLADERPIIASVIYNRLVLNMPLGIDSTIVYASKLIGKWKYDGKIYQSDLQLQSPYNTRINVGLPPGPIASPSVSSIRAALYPAQTKYLYYVRNPDRDDGAHNFYENGADFEKGVSILRNWEKSQKR